MITRRNLTYYVQNFHKSHIIRWNSVPFVTNRKIELNAIIARTCATSSNDEKKNGLNSPMIELRKRLRAKHLNQIVDKANISQTTMSEKHYSCDVEDLKSNFLNESNKMQKTLKRTPARQFLRKRETKQKKRFDEVFEMKFGVVRLDSMNSSKFTNINKQKSSYEPELSYNSFDEQYFSKELESDNCENIKVTSNGSNEDLLQIGRKDNAKLTKSDSKLNNTGNASKENVNIFDEEYFEGVSSVGEEYTRNNDNFTTEKTINIEYTEKETPEVVILRENFPKKTYIKNTEIFLNSQKVQDLNEKNDIESANMFDSQYFEGTLNNQPTNEDNKKGSKEFTLKIRENEEEEKNIVVETETKQMIRNKNKLKPNIENPETAYDLAMKLRLEEKLRSQKNTNEENDCVIKGSRLDSKGFRILSDQVPPFHKMSNDVIVNILKDSVLYEDDQLLVLDKPYGLASHGGPGIKRSIGQFLNPLSDVLKCGRLYVGHRLDKETTGVMVLAKDETTLGKLQLLFKEQRVKKKYLALTKGVPDPLSGIVDIPIGEHKIDGKYRMGVIPDYSNEELSLLNRNKRGSKSEAITQYRVLTHNHSVGLVLLIPKTGVKHQLRCHLAFALNTPVLGDHKYSHSNRFAPQKLFPETLQRLQIRQAKVRHIAMHLHAHTIVLPEWRDGKNLFFIARLPAHFTKNMKNLKISYNFFKDRL